MKFIQSIEIFSRTRKNVCGISTLLNQTIFTNQIWPASQNNCLVQQNCSESIFFYGQSKWIILGPEWIISVYFSCFGSFLLHFGPHDFFWNQIIILAIKPVVSNQTFFESHPAVFAK